MPPKSATSLAIQDTLDDLDGITLPYFNNVQNTITAVARVHPRLSNILVVNLSQLRSMLGNNLYEFPAPPNSPRTIMNIALASPGRLGEVGAA
jgi:hypothetical protein